MRLSKEDIRRVGRYFAVQYLSDQRSALKRISWSWKRSRFALGKTWSFMVKQFRLRSKEINVVRCQFWFGGCYFSGFTYRLGKVA